MYAVIQTGGKQYRVEAGTIVQLEKLAGEVGSAVNFDQVLFVAKPDEKSPQIWLGKPTIRGAKVEAEVVGQGRGEKILIVKKKRRKGYKRTQGHRQEQTQVLITGIDNGSGEKATLSAADKKAKVSSFFSQLKPKGPASTPKTLGSRKRAKAAATKTSA